MIIIHVMILCKMPDLIPSSTKNLIPSLDSCPIIQVTCYHPWRNLLWSACYYHFTYAFRSESTLYNCLNAKELLAQNRHDIWSLSDSNIIRTHNYLVRKRTLNHLAKLALSVRSQSGCGFESRCCHLLWC